MRRLKLHGGRLLHFFGWWAGSAGLVASTGNCPCCGQQGCPVMPVLAAAAGGFCAVVMSGLQRVVRRQRARAAAETPCACEACDNYPQTATESA